MISWMNIWPYYRLASQASSTWGTWRHHGEGTYLSSEMSDTTTTVLQLETGGAPKSVRHGAREDQDPGGDDAKIRNLGSLTLVCRGRLCDG